MDEELAKNLLTIWQSELTAMATDRELQEHWVTMVGLWAQTANAAITAFSHESAPGSPIPPQPPRASPSHAASGDRLDEINELTSRVRDLERRLAELLDQHGQPAAAGNPPAN